MPLNLLPTNGWLRKSWKALASGSCSLCLAACGIHFFCQRAGYCLRWIRCSYFKCERLCRTMQLEGAYIWIFCRLNKEPPNMGFRRKDKGGINFTSTVANTHLDLETVKAICGEYKIHNADISLRFDATADDLIDVIEGNRIYMPCIYVVNKIDQITVEELEVLDRLPHYCPIRYWKILYSRVLFLMWILEWLLFYYAWRMYVDALLVMEEVVLLWIYSELTSSEEKVLSLFLYFCSVLKCPSWVEPGWTLGQDLGILESYPSIHQTQGQQPRLWRPCHPVSQQVYSWGFLWTHPQRYGEAVQVVSPEVDIWFMLSWLSIFYNYHIFISLFW